ncbi:hypothetical protein BDN72DRAFT_85532 [Pluteus cervinus]|uniref:Uncharacterized protein n=1 Tax=Pluteus cervinus TaxID=181527 RepID=A0ACD3AP50_9AGAR|nr:hypothetical protein BDN72DRAFT_85532 [Pluteus cervinus]
MTINISNLHVNLPQGQVNLQNNGTPSPSGNVSEHHGAVENLRNRMCVGASFDSAERGDPPQCHKDTRKAILSSASSWVDDLVVQYFFLWILGWAGVGKSAILQTLAERYWKQDRLAASFFFFQASHDRNSIHAFVASIAYQLTISVPGAREAIAQKISNDPTVFTKSFKGQWQTLVVGTLRSVPPPSSPMLIVVDGIDEIVSHDEQRTLLRTILGSVSELGPGYKLLIASRPEQQIQRTFEEFGVSEGNKIELGDTDDDRADIALFLRLSLQEIYSKFKRLPSCTPTTHLWPGQDEIQCLVDKASGQFIYATTVVRFVGDHDGDPNVPLEMIINSRSKSFKDLDYLYLIVMRRIQKSTKRQHHHFLHYLMVCMFLDLVIRFMDEVEEYCPKELDEGLANSLLGKLDPIANDKGRYRHKSFTEFLTRPSAPHPFSITSYHISSVTSQILQSRPHDVKLAIGCILGSSPTPELIFRLMSWSENVAVDSPGSGDVRYPWDTTWLHRWTLHWLAVEFELASTPGLGLVRIKTSSRTRRVLLYSQIPLFLLVGLPYYTWLTVKQTSPYLYMIRSHDVSPQFRWENVTFM